VNQSQAGRLLRGRRSRSVCRATLLLLLVAVALPPGSLHADAPLWRVASGDVRISVPLRPGGAFEARSSGLAGELRATGSTPVLLTGTIAVDLTTIDTGIGLRNRHLRENYLEIAKGDGFDKAVLSEVHVAAAASAAFRGKSGFTATLLLHGVKQSVSGECEIRDSAPGVLVQATFPLGLRDFGIEPPQYMGVGVGNRLLVRVELHAAAAQGAGQ
jgi:polyisoprenoid-binding protein YceI